MGAVGFFKVSKALNSIAFSIYPNYFSFYTPISTDECGELKKIALIFGVFFPKFFELVIYSAIKLIILSRE